MYLYTYLKDKYTHTHIYTSFNTKVKFSSTLQPFW